MDIERKFMVDDEYPTSKLYESMLFQYEMNGKREFWYTVLTEQWWYKNGRL